MMVNDTPVAFDGPVELVRAIFDTAARQERSTALQLVRVCRTARDWVMPILYETVELDNPSAARFDSMLRAPPSPTSPTSPVDAPSLVKTLSATCLPDVERLSQRCAGIRAVTVASYDVRRLHRLALPSLAHLTVCGHLRYARLAAGMPAFRTVTHLRFADDVPKLPSSGGSGGGAASALPRLTHFACSYRLHKATQHRELEECLQTVLAAPALRVALVCVEDPTPETMRAAADAVAAAAGDDRRVVLVASAQLPPREDDASQFWRFAEKAVALNASRSARY